MKKISILLLIISVCFIVCGCEKEEKVKVGNSTINVSNLGHKKCSRNANVSNGDASFNYDIYYKDDYIYLIKSSEKVTSSNSDVLDQYEEAYKKIKAYYEGLDNYNQDVIRDSNSVENVTVINYDKLDMNKLIEIEGNENNLYENNKLKLNTWLEFAEKFGTKCEEE